MIPHPRVILRIALLLALACCSGFLTDTVRAQEETAATINGQVTDSTGAIVTGATVVVTNTETNTERRVETNDDGLFIVTPLSPGTYIVTVEQPNFKRYEASNVVLNARDRRPVNVVLEAGNVTEVVTVTAEQTTVQDSPTTQTLISGTQIVELPIVNRDVTKLVELVPGVSSDLDDETVLGLSNRVSISIAGNRRNSVNFFVDGVSNTDVGSNITLLSIPTVDSIKEFKVLTSNYTAEVGRSGGGTITVVTRGGGNQFSGSLYEFVRNDYFNANSFFNNRRGRNANGDPIADVPKLRYNNFGGTIGGPVFLPRFGEGGPAFYNGRNKTFFFFSEEVRRQTRGITDSSATVPTSLQRTGNFTEILGLPLFRQANGAAGTTVTETPLLVTDTTGAVVAARQGQIFRPSDGRAYAGNIIPTNEISPLALPLLNAFPLPDRSNGSIINTVTFTPINISNTRQETIRIDHNFNNSNRLFGRYTHDLAETREAGGLFTGIVIPNIATTQTRIPGQTFVASYTALLSPTVINEATYNFSGNFIGSNVVGRGRRSDYPGSELIPEAFPENNNNAIPTLSISGISTIASLQGFNIQYKNQVVRDVLTATVGNHTLKFGGEVSFESKNENANNVSQGSFVFNGLTTRGSSTTGVALGALSGNGLADYLLGRAASYSESEFDVTVNLRFGRREFFAQDTWRIRPNLTLDYGVRYQYFKPVIDENNTLASFDPTLYRASAAPTFLNAAGTALVRGTGNEFNGIGIAGRTSQFGRSIYPSDKNNFSPRVGFAYDPFSKGKTIIRGGYGFFYDQPLVGIFEVAAFVTPPFNNSATYTSSTANPVTLSNPTGGALGALPIRSLTAIAPDFETPTIQQYSLGIQHEVFRNAIIDIGYVGTKGDNLIRRRNINFVQPADVVRVGAGNVNTIRPFLGYGAITYFETSAKSRYNGLLSSFNYRFGNGLSITTSYTFSKTLTDSTNDRDPIDDPQNPFNVRPEYAEARTSRPHIFSASYVYELPFFTKSDNTLARTLLGGLQISGITNIESGSPIARAVNVAGIQALGAVGVYPNLISNPRGGLAGQLDPITGLPYIFDPNAFAAPTAGNFGNAGRSFARNPGRNNTNLSLIKNFNFNKEGNVRLQLRAESFNIFNHTQFLGVATTFFGTGVSSNFAQPTATRLPREFQFGVKLNF